jgi:hypothetical protein
MKIRVGKFASMIAAVIVPIDEKTYSTTRPSRDSEK